MEAELLTGWSQAELIPNSSNAYGTSGTPALAVFGDRLFCARQRRGNNGDMYCGTYDGNSWSDDATIPANNPFQLSASPALCEFNGTLYCVFEGSGDSGWTWAASLD